MIAVLLLAGCTPEHPQSTFDTQGPVARSQLILFYWIFWAAVFVFITVGGALLYVTIRYRRKPGDGALGVEVGFLAGECEPGVRKGP